MEFFHVNKVVVLKKILISLKQQLIYKNVCRVAKRFIQLWREANSVFFRKSYETNIVPIFLETSDTMTREKAPLKYLFTFSCEKWLNWNIFSIQLCRFMTFPEKILRCLSSGWISWPVTISPRRPNTPTEEYRVECKMWNSENYF